VGKLGGDVEPAFVDRLHTEAMSLAYAARDRAARFALARVPASDPIHRLQITAASLHLTALVADVVAWTLLRKAVAVGEIDASALDAERWAPIDLPPVVDPSGRPLPPDLARLLEKAQRLHRRIHRLHQRHADTIGDH